MYEFIRIQYALGRLNTEQVYGMITKGYITADQADTIINGN